MSQLTPETEESRAHEQPQGAAPSSAPTLGTRRRLTTPRPQLCNESCGFSQNPKHHLRRTTRRSPALHPNPSPPQSQPHQNYFCSPNLSRTSAAPDLRPPTGTRPALYLFLHAAPRTPSLGRPGGRLSRGLLCRLPGAGPASSRPPTTVGLSSANRTLPKGPEAHMSTTSESTRDTHQVPKIEGRFLTLTQNKSISKNILGKI